MPEPYIDRRIYTAWTGAMVVAAFEAGSALEWPELTDWARRTVERLEGALVADLLKLLLKIRARESNVAPRLVARSDELEQLAAGRREGLAILEGWRFEEFGRDALDLVEGRLAFAIRGGKLVMTRTEQETML